MERARQTLFAITRCTRVVVQIVHHPWVLGRVKVLDVAWRRVGKVDGCLIEVAIVELGVKGVLSSGAGVSDRRKVVGTRFGRIALLRAIKRILSPRGGERGPASPPMDRIGAIRVMSRALAAAHRAIAYALDVLGEKVVLQEHIRAPPHCHRLARSNLQQVPLRRRRELSPELGVARIDE